MAATGYRGRRNALDCVDPARHSVPAGGTQFGFAFPMEAVISASPAKLLRRPGGALKPISDESLLSADRETTTTVCPFRFFSLGGPEPRDPGPEPEGLVPEAVGSCIDLVYQRHSSSEPRVARDSCLGISVPFSTGMLLFWNGLPAGVNSICE